MMGLEDSMTSNLSRGPVLLRRFLLLWALALSVALSPYAAQPLMAQAAAAAQPAIPSGVERVTSVEGITEYRLANGLRVLLFPDPSKPTITVNMTYLVGSRHEGYGETGMAHLLEHLLFKGTPKHPNIPQELTEHGARPERHHLVRPHQLLRDLRGHRREPDGRSTSRPTGWSTPSSPRRISTAR